VKSAVQPIDESLTALPRLLPEGRIEEAPLSPAFHERFPVLLIGRRTQGTIWPDHSENEAALECYREGYKALHEEQDAVAAMRAYEQALEHDPLYFRAWVDLAIASLMDNTAESIEKAEGIFSRLCAIEPDGEWLTREVASMLRQNLGYTRVVRYRRTGDRTYLELADSEYKLANALAEQERLELLCPWAYVKLERGEKENAERLWERAKKATVSQEVLAEYVAKYVPLRLFWKENQ
jgi:tetratricopeptide (TPR) repeat protein